MENVITLDKSLKSFFQENTENLFNALPATPSTISKFSVGYSGGMWTHTKTTEASDIKIHADIFLERHFKSSEHSLMIGFEITKSKCPTLPVKKAQIRIAMSMKDFTQNAYIDATDIEGLQGEKTSIGKLWANLPEKTQTYILTVGRTTATYVATKVLDRLAPYNWIENAYEIKRVLQKLPKK